MIRGHLYGCNRRQITSSYLELAATLTELADGRELILDGAIIAQASTGARLRTCCNSGCMSCAAEQTAHRRGSVRLFLFDVLADSGNSLTAPLYLELRDRLHALEFTATPVQTHRAG
ncbi:hypothetical protein [Nocardia cyriacigeorgica]|uniref:ATP-dependent DNA ligase family profile domain-containing protein n=1 Tax=Nocardia cyriacigeorgica TaxID=135487 RepID=A0A5R8NA03_9NOCA|nr:hypothetical protein [Nocardia cyriacigeorgica]MBF6427879.1 hypothetical protein [Nocardia cyriacigeorgica]TLF72456.1 hypothetical protein FEK34_29325 [Nocardia cyriacigeorgica]